MTDARFFQTTYDQAACDLGVVHVGYGAFHRAHQAVYLDDYMQMTGDLRWGIAAVNLRAGDAPGFATAARAPGGYLLKSISPDTAPSFRLVRAHCAFADAAQDLNAALDLVARPSVHAVSMTVTESGYAFKNDWTLDLDAPAVAADLAQNGTQTIYGFLAAALKRRAERDAPVTVLCCDNIRSNGTLLHAAVLRYLDALGDHALAAWVSENTQFPCSMVDRITPRSTEALRDEVKQLFPEYAAAPLHAEAFSQWVLQDQFAGPMPDLTRVGVQVVANVEPYEEAKIRILNGGHTGLCYLGALAGHQTFDQAMADPRLRAHFDAWETEEVLLGLKGLIPFDETTYLAEVALRFENAGIADQLERICMDGFSKMAIYIRPTLEACLKVGKTPRAGYDCVASWVVFARRAHAGTAPLPYHEPLWDKLAPLLAPDQTQALASEPQLWGALPTQYPSFTPDLVDAIQKMDQTWQD